MYQLTHFESRAQLDQQFAEQVAQLLENAINEKGKASLAVSGGSTPKGFFQALSKHDITWEKVTITLADERWVDETSDASNTRLVKENLLQNKASKAQFFALKVADSPTSEVLAQLKTQAEQTILPLDVLILGMGEDGHTASLFPCSEQIAQAISLENNDVFMAVTPTTAPHQRITFTLASLLQSKQIFLHLCGENKQQVLQQALADTNALTMPIRAFLHHESAQTRIMYAN